ncbi:hypothetical protein LCGC14_2314750 [marine sediment metagenome]|uniref:Uncharacterized protein n=1 Tax=marine sediment metagenome TaxID=412755 RepID=A0A0F9D770_9ZZZZ
MKTIQSDIESKSESKPNYKYLGHLSSVDRNPKLYGEKLTIETNSILGKLYLQRKEINITLNLKKFEYENLTIEIMTEQIVIRSLKRVTLSILTEYIKTFPTKKIQIPKIKFNNLFNGAISEYDTCKNLVQLDRRCWKKFGYSKIKRIFLHELTHLLVIKVYDCYDHSFHFHYTNQKLQGIKL